MPFPLIQNGWILRAPLAAPVFLFPLVSRRLVTSVQDFSRDRDEAVKVERGRFSLRLLPRRMSNSLSLERLNIRLWSRDGEFI
jgi:hypothetical protein